MRQADGKLRHKRKAWNHPNHAHELTFSCYRRLRLLASNHTRTWFIQALQRVRTDYNVRLWAYVLMPEHAHVLLMPREPDYDIAAILKSIKQGVSRRAVNHLRLHQPGTLAKLRVTRADGRIEHRFWQRGGGYDRNINNPDTAQAAIAYIHHNPVRAGLVKRATDWPWSSARWYANHDDALLTMDQDGW